MKEAAGAAAGYGAGSGIFGRGPVWTEGPSARAPIVALTADAAEEERARARKAGVDDFITKPIDAPRLLAVAARFTERENPPA